MAAKGQPPSRDCFPVAPIRRIVARVLEERNAEYEAATGLSNGASWDSERMGPSASVVFDIWGSDEDFSPVGRSREIYRLLNEHEFIRFDRADKILCGLGLFMLWHEDPELNAIWNSGVVAEADARDERRAARARAAA